MSQSHIRIEDLLPTGFSNEEILALIDSLDLPEPTAIRKVQWQGAYHVNYCLSFTEADIRKILKPLSPKHPYVPDALLLRVSGAHLPVAKTENDSAILTYVSRNTNIPVPTLIRFSSSTQNPLKHEYQLMTIADGVTVDSVFQDMADSTAQSLLDQVADLLRELHSIPISHIGGFRFDLPPSERSSLGLIPSAPIVPAPLCEEFLWQIHTTVNHWHLHGIKVAFTDLNAQGPFHTWTSYIIAWLHKYIYAISQHPLVQDMHDLIPRISSLISLLSSPSFVAQHRLDEMRLLLAHRDLHFSNLLWDPASQRITAVLDWEFSGAAPFCGWDPPKAFLASLPYDEEGLTRKRKWVRMFKDRCEERGVEWRELAWDGESEEFGWKIQEQRWVYECWNYLRCIFEVGPTGERRDAVLQWKGEVEERLGALGC